MVRAVAMYGKRYQGVWWINAAYSPASWTLYHSVTVRSRTSGTDGDGNGDGTGDGGGGGRSKLQSVLAVG